MKPANYNHIRRHTQQGFWASLLAGALMMGMSSMTQAAPLNLLLNDAPDIFSSFISVGYNAGADSLSATGFAFTLDDDGVGSPHGIAGGSFNLLASIDNSGSLLGGTLNIGGTIADLGFNSGTLLTGTLTDFGFVNSANPSPLEFLFNVTGGDAASLYDGIGGIILHMGSGMSTGFSNWDSDFANSSYGGSADVGIVPIPAALWLFGSALIGLLGFGRNSRRKQHS